MKIAYIKRNFKQATLDIIDKANVVITGMMAQDIKLNLRQIYYAFISNDLLPDSWIDEAYNLKQGLDIDTKNTQKNYKRLGSIIGDGRMAGLIDWDSIEDLTRNATERGHWSSPSQILHGAASSYTTDLWTDQEAVPEVWIEKRALAGVFIPPCTKLDTLIFPCAGYGSITAMHEAAMRIKERYDNSGRRTRILHFGDHDPSGVDMSRDIFDRLAIFIGGDYMELDRIALNMNQVTRYNLSPDPAKVTDSRAKAYIANYGSTSWELDALDPPKLRALVNTEIEATKSDPGAFDDRIDDEEQGQADLRDVADNWDNR